MPRYHGLIPDIRGSRILAIPAGDGLWTLPDFQVEAEWFAYASTAVAGSATERYGVPMTALREHSAGDVRVCELEIQVPQWTPPSGMRWVASGELLGMQMQPAALTEILGAWFRERQTGDIPALRPPWERRGWYAEAAQWIVSQCQRLGYAPCSPVEQLKAGWTLSSILRINTSVGVLYFKADLDKPPSEPAIIQALAQRWPRNVPEVVAADPARGWMLTRDFGNRALDRAPIARWQAANRTFSAMQVACSDNLEPWWRLKCPDFRIPALVTGMNRLLEDGIALRIGEPDGLTDAMATQLRQLTPRLHDMWGELADIPVPDSLVQQDFRHGNLVIAGRSYLFYDWSDTVIGPPFFACCRFLDYLPASRHGLPLNERARRITDAYLQPWEKLVGRDDLHRAFALTRKLNPIYVAIRRHRDAPWCEPGSSWGRRMREEPAKELRRLLMDMD